MSKDLFEEKDIDLAQLGAVLASSLEVALGPVSIVMYVIHEESGQVGSATNLDMGQLSEFLKFILAQQRAGDYTVTGNVVPETKQ
jgi:hypothetical protein